MARNRTLNEAFKRFQRLPELPTVPGSDLPTIERGEKLEVRGCGRGETAEAREQLEEVFAD